MPEPFIKTPWNTPMDPGEFQDYYDRKRENLKQECKRENCTGTTEWPKEYCSHRCKSHALERAMSIVVGEEPPPPLPEEPVNWQPNEMQERIEELRRMATD